MVVGKLYGINVHYVALALISVCLIVAITSSPPAALMVALPIVITLMLTQGTPADVLLERLPGIARVSAIAATTFETLPFNGLIILTLGLAGTNHKQSYRPMLYMTVLWTLLGAVVAGLLIALFPGLA
jgi:H+/gluconate symporter-like permease